MTGPDFARLQALVPQSPGWSVDWGAIWPLWPGLAALDACPQNPVHHGEGDVGIHTRMVVEALVAEPRWRALPPERRSALFWAAVLHDIGKPATTRQEDGRLTARGHSRIGALMARRLLWEAGAPFAWRERLCGIVAAHQLPFWLIEREAPGRLAVRTSWTAHARDLCLHALADARGRIADDVPALIDNIALAEATFEEAGAADTPYPFANAESRVAYFEREDRDAAYAAHRAPRLWVTVMTGLPGAGKDSWLAAHAPDLPVVSLDAIRAEIGAAGTGDQGRVIQAAREAARVHLRAGRAFAWNATNVTRMMRAKICDLARDYGAALHIVYLEPLPGRLFAQNRGRGAAVPQAAVARLADKLEPPAAWEAHRLTLVVDGTLTAPPFGPI
ncbi:MAG: AAA family ATPase [Pseudomonadota bacterium]